MCQVLWNGGMQNTKIFRVMFSSIKNTEFFCHHEAFWGFFPLEAKIQNGE
jgi:hypothetical protein